MAEQPAPTCKHTRAPTDYLAWHAWAEKKAKTHDQHQCPGCGLWLVWKRKPPPDTTPLDHARRAWCDHMAACSTCAAGRPCLIGDPLDKAVGRAASDDLPWSLKMSHPPAIALAPVGQTEIAAFQCSTCRMTWTVGADPAWARKQAETCCSPVCDACGGPKPIRGYCEPCQRARETAAEQKRYDAAEKITPADHTGPVYNEMTDRFYGDVGEALERADADMEEPPSYLWPCDIDTATIDPDRVIESITEDMHEDYEVDDYAGLAAFCKEWNAKQTGGSWTPNYSRVIVIDSDGSP